MDGDGGEHEQYAVYREMAPNFTGIRLDAAVNKCCTHTRNHNATGYVDSRQYTLGVYEQ